MKSGAAALALLLAACGSSGEAPKSGADTNTLKRVSTPKQETEDPKASVRLQTINQDDLQHEGLELRGERSIADVQRPRDEEIAVGQGHEHAGRPAAFTGDVAASLRQEDASRINQPALVVLGDRTDPIFRERRELLLDWLPNAEPFDLPGATHLLHLENPRGMAEGLAAFFARHPLQASL